MDGLDAAIQARPFLQLLQGQARRLLQRLLENPAVRGEDLGLAAAPVVQGGNVPRELPLAQKLLHHSQRNAETACHLLAGEFARVIDCKDSFAEINGQCAHPFPLPQLATNDHIFI